MYKWLKNILTGFFLVPILYGVWLLLRCFVFDYFTIPTSSMCPTLEPGDKVIVNKLLMGARIYTNLDFDLTGQELESWALKEAVFDGNILTGFNSISPDGNWVGLKLSSPRKVGRIRFIGRNDGNGIEIGDEYMLMCWCDGWKTFGVIKAENNHVIFNNVPSGGLYVLRNLPKGHEERIFTYENQEQVWW